MGKLEESIENQMKEMARRCESDTIRTEINQVHGPSIAVDSSSKMRPND